MDNRTPSMLKAAAIGGGAAGLASAVPILNLVNCACCALVIGGGLLAAYLYSGECRRAGAAFRAGAGATVGLVAALFYAVGAAVLGSLVQLVLPPPDIEQMTQMFEQFDLPPEALDWAERWISSTKGILGLVFGFFLNLIIAAIFSTIGGLIGGAAFKVEPAPPAPPQAPAMEP